MSYATLMVHVDPDPTSNVRVQLAADLAERIHATLIGVAGWRFIPVRLSNGPATNGEPSDQERQEMKAILDRMGRDFCIAAKSVGNVEWRGVLDYSTELVPREARAADLVIVGRSKVARDIFFSLDPDVVVVRAGRPVLVVPNTIGELRARRVVIAWKDTREARRAVRDALPFLQDADEVSVVEVSEDATKSQTNHLEDVANYLVRHRVVVGAKVHLPANGSVAAGLIRFAKGESSDLIVAGGYGHSRMGEWIFGGVTRDLLSASPVCCLFSH